MPAAPRPSTGATIEAGGTTATLVDLDPGHHALVAVVRSSGDESFGTAEPGMTHDFVVEVSPEPYADPSTG